MERKISNNIIQTNFINHSGGADGSDKEWCIIGQIFGVKTISYSFEGHNCLCGERKILNEKILLDKLYELQILAMKIRRRYPTRNKYIDLLLARDYYMVSKSTKVIAIGYMNDKYEIEGGTAWGVETGKYLKLKVYIFNINDGKWYKYTSINKNNLIIEKFLPIDECPSLDKHTSLIGTRRIYGEPFHKVTKAMFNVFEKTFSKGKYSINIGGE